MMQRSDPKRSPQPTQLHHPPLPPAARRPAPPPRRPRTSKWWLITPLIAIVMMGAGLCAALSFGVLIIYNSGILPGVSAAGVELGGMSQAEAVSALANQFTTLTLRDGRRTWALDPADLGITLDANATADRAYQQGRGEGNIIRALLGRMEVEPVLRIDLVQAAVTLDQLAPEFALPPVNAGIELVNGQVQPTAAQAGRAVNVAGLIGLLETDPDALLADGEIELPMLRVDPAITDATPLLNQARALLESPLRVELYDPITDSRDAWQIPSSAWSQWLTVQPDSSHSSSGGLALALQPAPLADYLRQQNRTLGDIRYVNVDEVVAALQDGLARNITSTSARVYHHDRQHVVQSGETVISIAWNYGVPYPWVQRANPGLGDTLSIGQRITIPSPDNFLEFPIVPNKRIVVSIGQQRTRVYENGQLKWDWIASTGIQDSPTWPGVYQVLLHDPNAYASRWNLQMPWFMGVYRPIPGDDFTNGFHGFPTRGGSQLLWINNLGTRVTYGCILLSSDNARLLYDWAEEGVIVEIQP